MNKKVKFTALFLCLLSLASAVYAVHYIYSNSVIIPAIPSYALTLNIDLTKTYYMLDTIHATGALTKDGNPVNDALIYILNDGVKIAEGSTDSLGIFDIPFTRTSSGDINVTARYDAP